MEVAKLTDVTRIYKIGEVETRALNGISMTIGNGEFTSLVGPSGSGKTTLLQLIGCLDQPTSGSVVINGRETTNLNRNQRADLRKGTIGFVFQFFALIPTLTAYENIEMPLLLNGKSPAERKQRVMELLEAVDITDRAYREAVYRAIGKHLKGVHPCSTGLIVNGLARPERVKPAVQDGVSRRWAPAQRERRALGARAKEDPRWTGTRTTAKASSAWPMCDPALRTPGIVRSSRLTLALIRNISGWPVPGLVSQCIRKSRSLKSGSSDCPRNGSRTMPVVAIPAAPA